MPVIDNATLRILLNKKKDKPGVESTCVQSHDWAPDSEDPTTGILTITFVGPPYGGPGTWEYYDVPLDVFTEFSTASSLGTYFNLYIRDQYEYSKI